LTRNLWSSAARMYVRYFQWVAHHQRATIQLSGKINLIDRNVNTDLAIKPEKSRSHDIMLSGK
jgi:hypothetical protein